MTTNIVGSRSVTRLQHFIDFAKDGEEVELEIETSRKVFDKDYLLVATFTRIGSREAGQFVSKIYEQGHIDESDKDDKINRHVASQRLLMDYDRLKKAGVHFKEKYF